MFKELISDNIRLRKYTLDDVDMIHRELGVDSEMFNYTGWNPFHTLESTRDMLLMYIDRYDNFDGNYAWVIEDGGRAVGTFGAYDYNSETKIIEIGYSIFIDEWGKGYASKSTKMVIDFLFSTGEVSAIRAWAAANNFASRGVLEKSGLKAISVIPGDIHVDENTVLNKVVYEIPLLNM